MQKNKNKPKKLTKNKENSKIEKKDIALPKDSPPQFEDFFSMEGMPPEAKKKLSELFMRVSATSLSVGPSRSPIEDKVTSKHVDKFIELADKDSEREIQEIKDQRKNRLIYFYSAIFLFIFLLLFFTICGEMEFIKNNWAYLITTIGGFLGGFGLGKTIK